MRHSPARLAGLFLLALLLPGAHALAQSVQGRAVEAGTGRSIQSVRVVLLAADGKVVSESLSGEEGLFHLVTVNAGEYRLRASHLAYETVTTEPFRVEGGEELVVDLTLSNTVIPLDPLVITARRIDPRQGSFIEGFYARQKMFTQGLGFGRVVTRIDPEMVNASNPRDVLLWLEPPNRGGIVAEAGCLVVYWDGRLVLTQENADQWLDTPASFFEGVEYYRHSSDAPAAFREIPLYLADRVSCSVVALWPKSGYFGEAPIDLNPPQGRLSAALLLYDLSGEFSPDLGMGVEIAGHVLAFRHLALGVLIRRTSHHLSAGLMETTLGALDKVPFVLPAGRRPFVLWVVGPEASLTLPEVGRVRPTVEARVLAAKRSFTLVSNSFGTPEVGISSLGLGVGVTVGMELLLTPRIAAQAALGYDRYSFGEYQELERPWYTSAGSWNGIGLRLGVRYSLGH